VRVFNSFTLKVGRRESRLLVGKRQLVKVPVLHGRQAWLFQPGCFLRNDGIDEC